MTVEVETTNVGCHVDVTPAALERLVQQASDANPYLVVTRDDRDGFAQAHVVPAKRDGRRRLLVEYRDRDDSPLRSAELAIDRAVPVLLGWAFDRDGWSAGIRWRTQRLESVVDQRGQCAFSDGPGGARRCRLDGTAAERAGDMPELAPGWDIVGEGATDDLAYAELHTQIAVFFNRAPAETRMSWGRWLGQFVIQVPRGQWQGVRLDEDQQRRIIESSSFVWPELPAEGSGA